MWYAGFKKLCYQTVFDYSFDLSIWYPTEYRESIIHYTEHYDGNVAANAPIGNTKFPLIAISCGYSRSQYDQGYLAESLARAGFIVVSFARPVFETRGGVKSLGVTRAWYRAYEMKLTIQYMMENFENYLDKKAGIGLLGFSAGAFTSLLLAGAIPQFEWDERFQTGIVEWKNELEKHDFSELVEPQVKSLVLMAPIFSEIFDSFQLKNVRQPILLMTAGCDEILKDSAEKYEQYLPFVVEHCCLKNAGHYVFNGPVNGLSKKLFADFLKVGIDRELFHSIILEKTVEFFVNQLKSIEMGESHVCYTF